MPKGHVSLQIDSLRNPDRVQVNVYAYEGPPVMTLMTVAPEPPNVKFVLALDAVQARQLRDELTAAIAKLNA